MRGSLRPVRLSGLDRAGPGTTIPTRRRQRELRSGATRPNRVPPQVIADGGAAASLAKGTRVIATGTLKPRTYTTKAGEARTVVELEVEDIGPSLRHATSGVTRTGPGPEQDEELPPDRFALSPREYGDDEVWFGLAANPAGHINVPAADTEPAVH